MMIFRYMSGNVYQGSWIDKFSGEVVKYYGTERHQLKAPASEKKDYSNNKFKTFGNNSMVDNRAYWH